MAIPAGYTMIQWYHKIVTDLLEKVSRLEAFSEFWPNLTASQKTAVKNQVVTTLDTTIQRLTDLKADIQAL
jgi:hypothetical protein